MKKILNYTIVLAVLLSVSASYAAKIHPSVPMGPFPVLGQAEMTHVSRPGVSVHVDWIVATSDITLGFVPDSDIVFADVLGAPPGTKKGTINDFRNNSVYYYFYEIENQTSNFVTGFTLNLNPSTVLTAGYIKAGYDLDSSLGVLHNIVGEDEVVAASKAAVTSASFDPTGSAPNMGLSFLPGGLPATWESDIFFVTCLAPPDYKINSIIAGAPALADELPVPTMPIPEPTSMALLGLSVLGYFIRRKK